MPQPSFNLFMSPPLGKRRCPRCGVPMFLATIAPSEQHDDQDKRTFECSSCAYAETVTVKIR